MAESPPKPTVDDADLAAAAPTTMVRVASGLAMVAGLATILVGVQNLVGYEITGLFFAILVGLILLGVVAVVIGWIHGKARAWASVASLIASALLALATFSWLVVSLAGGGLSAMAFLAVLLSGLSTLVGPFSIGPCRRATAARDRLRDAGLDLGI